MKGIKVFSKSFSNFECLKSDCPYTCCRDWNIQIDNQTLKKYKKLQDETKSFIFNNLSTANTIILNKTFCPFLNENKLCKIQLKYGENYLCSTCKNFPNGQIDFDNFQKNFHLLSCPKVFDIVNNLKIFEEDIYFFKEKEVKEKGKVLNTDYYFFIRDKLNYLLNLHLKLNQFIFVAFNFYKDIEVFINQNKNKEELNNFFNNNYFNHLKKTKNFNLNKLVLDKTIDEFVKMLSIQNFKNRETRQFVNSYPSLQEAELDAFLNKTSKKYKLNNLFTYLLLLELPNNIYEKNLLANFKLSYMFLKLSIAFLHLSTLDFKVINACLFRAIYHTNTYKNLTNSLKQ